MEATKSYITIYDVMPEAAQDFQFEFATFDTGLLTQLVPDQDDWGSLAWGIELEEYEYQPKDNTITMLLSTKWESPVEWLRNASLGSHYFENKLVVMTTIQKDETSVTGVAVMDGEVLQNKNIWCLDAEEVGKYYDDNESAFELDDLDNQIWDAITKFVDVCEQFYLEREQEND